MHTLLKKTWLLLIPFLLLSCMKEKYEDCAVYLEFIFDHNMDYTDLFESEVDMVDVYVFDAGGYYLFSRHADCITDLTGGKRMYLEEGFSLGTYKIITVGALTRYFRFTDLNDQTLTPGVSTIEDVKLALYHETNDVEDEFPHLWYGEPVEIEFRADLSVWPVHLIRETNHFTIHVEETGNNAQLREATAPTYTFDIITPEAGAYGHDNTARVKEPVTYHPYSVTKGGEAEIVSEAKIMTMRLLSEERAGYRLLVRNIQTGDVVWSYNLMDMLEKSKPEVRESDGSYLPLQEYLDREWDWYITIRGSSAGGAFVTTSIIVNSWIIWLRDIEI